MQDPFSALANSAGAAPVAAHGQVQGLRIFGVTLIGATQHNWHKLLLTIAFIVIAWIIAWVLRQILKLFIGTRSGTRFQFWAKQGVSLIVAAILILGVMSIWFDSPARLASVLGLIGAGIAFALQRVITAVAGYFVILRGKTFNVGDRILMGGVRGDVIGLTFMQTRIMEMGQSPREEDDQDSWVHSRQFTGRIVTVTNDKVFDCPVYNYTHEFAYLWDEISLPVHYHQDFAKAEKIILDSATKHALTGKGLGKREVDRLEKRFGIDVAEIDPRVFWRITEDWLELTVRFLGRDHGIRGLKDQMTRDIMASFQEAGIMIAAVRQEAVTGPQREKGKAEA
ncbi:MAG TPA: mechanosensitive ion channel domain-containing protein [Sphingomicrobium sp.]|nr:mechanosensitive ion channel domain-containing protein [Sphingomicrobium sp.]